MEHLITISVNSREAGVLSGGAAIGRIVDRATRPAKRAGRLVSAIWEGDDIENRCTRAFDFVDNKMYIYIF